MSWDQENFTIVREETYVEKIIDDGSRDFLFFKQTVASGILPI